MSSNVELKDTTQPNPLSPSNLLPATASSTANSYKVKETKFKLSPEDRIEYEHIYALFAGEEKNISAKEMGKVMTKLGIHCSKDELNDMIDVVDKDGYGLVHKKHFMNLMTQKVKETTQESDGEVYEDAFEM
jgi:Ca2+-binding EF-hand superfamily protein